MPQCNATDYVHAQGDMSCTAPAVYDTPSDVLCGTHAYRARLSPAETILLARMLRPDTNGQDASPRRLCDA